MSIANSKYIRLLRVKDWVKNLFVFAPTMFAGEMSNLSAWLHSGFAFFMFCLCASLVYIINDLHDIESDRQHPVKKVTRPIASGEVEVRLAIKIALALFFVVSVLSATIMPMVWLLLLIYLALMLAYTFYLKSQPILDVFTISAGFVIRIYVGALAIAVPVSAWMFITTLALALYLACIKRRQEVLGSGENSRPVLKYYSQTLITRYAEMSGGATLVFYSLFVVTEKQQMVFTIPIVLFALFRYWYVVEARNVGESPADVFTSDAQLIAAIVVWIGTTAYLL